MPNNAGHLRRRPPFFRWVWAPCLPSCTRTISDGSDAAGSGIPAVAGGGVDSPTIDLCGGVAAAPIRPLNRFEYDSTLSATQREREGAP
jgi:hypothetical protein